MQSKRGQSKMESSCKPKEYLEVEGGDLDAVLDWLIDAQCPYSVREAEYPNEMVQSVHSALEEQAKEIESLIAKTARLETALEKEIKRADDAENEVEELLAPSSRRPPPHFRLPDERPSVTHAFHIGTGDLGKGYITAGYYPGTKDVGEVFIKMNSMVTNVDSLDSAKQQISDLTWFLKGILDQLAISVSIGLQRGIPLSVYVNRFSHTKFTPDGMTRNKEIPRCSSIVDYLFRWLGRKFEQV